MLAISGPKYSKLLKLSNYNLAAAAPAAHSAAQQGAAAQPAAAERQRGKKPTEGFVSMLALAAKTTSLVDKNDPQHNF